ncbi:hypothetical protein TanjilG_16475 [Lupinus angustifolius]|uniref:Uncharacterized protein n=1 Tax=Lupinus angustifolius TaxID=3871 RepID=A0A1J7HKL3_LUPAN|nr:PREDICTED: uncharacterized protein LOC109345934 [Lupinus angustifolius]OIW13366.1 hypothetical protein TanjilG_16475 [Lupinus angustifolius]
MGCCFSTPNTKQEQNNLKNQPPQHNSTPPPPLPQHLEEETVKEVLSETPIYKSHQDPFLMAKTNTQMPKIEKGRVPIMNKACSMSESFSQEVSQISETCSISKSFSTTTVTEKREDEATSKRRTTGTQSRKKRSDAGDGNKIGERERMQKNPARIPGKRFPVSSPEVRRKEPGQLRRDSGEGYRRQSRSPSSARTVGGGVGRNQMKLPDVTGRRLPPDKCVKKEMIRKENDVVPHEESFENPHISLECFIFV